nr:MAG TPA: hypothetical protein [Caudoviricetes sp.]DAY51830.1 MAG TPA: hypothetical protein [Caudoviricetes sp.]
MLTHRPSRWFICSSKFRFSSEKLHCAEQA